MATSIIESRGASHPRPHCAVIGLGNPLRGDDGIGPRVVEELRRRGLPPGVESLDAGNAGFHLLDVLDRAAVPWERVIIVDAAYVGKSPGQFVRFTPQEAELARAGGAPSLHAANLSEVLALADALGLHLPELVIFGVQPAETGWQEGLSPAVAATLPALMDAIMDEIEGDDNYA